ncbi:4205_t:CDS:2 [Entrophospora sp. SA101]|nr:4205_t:CDS:2 [Entrophospora sp. SA101]
MLLHYLIIQNGVFEVKRTNDTLGAKDFDDALVMNYVMRI